VEVDSANLVLSTIDVQEDFKIQLHSSISAAFTYR